ncbi:hypothetical protein HaLaN_31885, partial [Haematococcus lacustris]
VAELTQPIKGKAARAKPAPQPGWWVDQDCNAALNMQRIEGRRWRPLELCWWLDLPELQAKGKEYPGLGYKRLRDQLRNQPCDGPGPFVTSISLAAYKENK